MDISVAIGRNIGDSPMSDTAWAFYKEDVRVALKTAGYSVYCEELGQSYYGTTTEECYRVFAHKGTTARYDSLRDQLDILRERYFQWGIALSQVETDMVLEQDLGPIDADS